jgi:hypothetical protein
MISISFTSIIKYIFWMTFLSMFFGHAFFRMYLFDIRVGGFGTKLYWFAELLLYVSALKLIFSNKYSSFFFKPNLFLFSFFIILASVSINFQSLSYSLLSLRIFYPFFLLAYIIYIYDFQKNTYRYFFKLFLYLAIINSIFSILQFTFMGFLGLSTQMTGGIFGFHGTGHGAIFSVIQSSLFLQIYLGQRKLKYLVYSFIIAIPIITGYAYGGFLFLAVALFIIIISHAKKINFFRLFGLLVLSLVILFSVFILAKNIQIEDAFQGYYNVFSSADNFKNKTIKYESGVTSGRIGLLIFGFDKMTENLKSFFIGHGPGSISYTGATTGIKNMSGYNIRGSAYPLMSYMYEMGIWGPLLLILAFYLLFKKWKKTKRPKQGIEMYYFDNMPVVLVVFLTALTYTTVLNIYFLVIFFAFNISYLNHLHKSQIYSNLSYNVQRKDNMSSL